MNKNFQFEKRPWELSRPHRLRGRGSVLDVAIGSFYRPWRDDTTFIVLRQRKSCKPHACVGCFFYETKGVDCPPAFCECYRRADRQNVIFKRLDPPVR